MPAEHLRPVLNCLSLLFAAVSLTQCVSESRPAPAAPADDTYWSNEEVFGAAKITISLEEQRVGLFKGGKLVGLSPISSGREGHDTHPGVFKVTEKDEDHRSSWYGAFVDEAGMAVVEDVDVRKDTPPPGTKFMGASMNWFMRFNGAIGMHQGYLPGYPASHGCIRLPGKMAALFFSATPHGTTVEVKKNAGLIDQRPAQAAPVTLADAPAAATPPAAAPLAAPASTTRPSVPSPSGLRPISPAVFGAPPAPMTLAPAPARKPEKKKSLPGGTVYLDGYGPN